MHFTGRLRAIGQRDCCLWYETGVFDLMGAIIGVDLGVTYSAVAHFDANGHPSIVLNSDGEDRTPSCVALIDGELRVGTEAYRQWCIEEARSRIETAAANFIRDIGTSKTYCIGSETYSPTELSTFLLRQLVQDASRALGQLGPSVVTVPANFSNKAREAIMVAACAAGLDVRASLMSQQQQHSSMHSKG